MFWWKTGNRLDSALNPCFDFLKTRTTAACDATWYSNHW